MASSSVAQLVASTAAALGVDPSLAMSVASAESGFNQAAVSRAGAIGVMQLEPGTAAGLGVDPTNLVQNIQGGIRYLGQLLAQFGGDVVKAVAAYNWGPGAVSRAIATYGPDWLSHAPDETKAYVLRVTGQASDSAMSATLSPEPTDLSLDANADVYNLDGSADVGSGLGLALLGVAGVVLVWNFLGD